ncbi:hypothetical protein ACA910_008289 [Epithemia clementina (nom. ined.)]
MMIDSREKSYDMQPRNKLRLLFFVPRKLGDKDSTAHKSFPLANSIRKSGRAFQRETMNIAQTGNQLFFRTTEVLGDSTFFWVGRGGHGVKHSVNKHVRRVIASRCAEYRGLERSKRRRVPEDLLRNELRNVKFVMPRDAVISKISTDRKPKKKKTAAADKKAKPHTVLLGASRLKSLLETHKSMDQIRSYPEGVCIEVGYEWKLDILKHLLREEESKRRDTKSSEGHHPKRPQKGNVSKQIKLRTDNLKGSRTQKELSEVQQEEIEIDCAPRRAPAPASIVDNTMLPTQLGYLQSNGRCSPFVVSVTDEGAWSGSESTSWTPSSPDCSTSHSEGSHVRTPSFDAISFCSEDTHVCMPSFDDAMTHFYEVGINALMGTVYSKETPHGLTRGDNVSTCSDETMCLDSSCDQDVAECIYPFKKDDFDKDLDRIVGFQDPFSNILFGDDSYDENDPFLSSALWRDLP